MDVLVSASARFVVTPDGRLWTSNASLAYGFWVRYLDTFDRVALLVRARPDSHAPRGGQAVTGPGVEGLVLPYFHGPWQFLRMGIRLTRAIRAATGKAQAIIIRVPCAIGSVVKSSLPPRRPYGVEVVGDPYDVFAPGTTRHPLRRLFRTWSARNLRGECRDACTAAYVTQAALQRRYPPSRAAFTTHYSSIDLSDDAFHTQPRHYTPSTSRTLITVGSMDHLHKSMDVLLDAMAVCVQQGLDLRLELVGDGRHRPDLERRALQAGIGQRVCFAGQLSTSQVVRERLDQADLFVLPSRQEGLPRAMIEAMAMGLPCIGSTVGGIPELLPPEDLVPAGDTLALARMIKEVVTQPARMSAMSVRNLERARHYHIDALRQRRISVYSHLKCDTSAWLVNASRSG